MSIVNFQGTDYQTNEGVIHMGATQLADLKGSELVTLHNLLNANIAAEDGIDNYKRVNKFSSKDVAIRRVTEKLHEWQKILDTEEEALKTTAGEPIERSDKPKRKPRGMRFVFPAEDHVRECRGSIKNSVSGDSRTLRQRVLAAMRDGTGATFEEIIEIVRGFDADRRVAEKNVERRAYEVARIIHYYLGYGLRQNGSRIVAFKKGE